MSAPPEHRDQTPHAPSEQTPATPSRYPLDRVVFAVSAAAVAVFLALALLFTQRFADVTGGVLSWLTTNFGWAFVLGATGFVGFSFWLMLSRHGKIRLGRDDERPEFSTVSWFAMMFSAGMGIGLLFYGVSEPISHLATVPEAGIEPLTQEAERYSMVYSLFHWALHPWSIYAVVGLALAYAWYRKGRTGGFSAPFAPLLRGRTGPAKVIDVLAIFATLFGTATSLGLGAAQINGGLDAVFGVPISATTQVLLVVVLTACFTLSAFSGIQRGIKWLSNTNMVLSIVLLFFLFVVGPTVFILNLAPTATGNYLTQLPRISFRTGAYGGTEWLTGWTIFYWAWWMSWAPFVGTFLARISRGRTIRQFVLGVVAAPSVIAVLWFSVLGGTALHAQMVDGLDLAGITAQESQFFALLDSLPLSSVSSLLVMAMIVIYFVTSADSASLVMSSLSSQGADEPNRLVTVVWALLIGATAAILLWVGGATGDDSSITALQNIAIIVAAPFLVVMVALCVALAKDLRSDPASPPAGFLRDTTPTGGGATAATAATSAAAAPRDGGTPAARD
ncbi:BCCT family transporter [Kineococcus terrestris]|uniref:BCCT family transporter n=1 Tax=Kineococcus terrestris TaxID=2044856 RepID=UPI0034DAC3E4